MTSIGHDELTVPYSRRIAAQDAARHAQMRRRAALTVCHTSDRNGDTRAATYELLAMLGLIGDDTTVGDVRTLDIRVGAGRVRPHIGSRRKG